MSRWILVLPVISGLLGWCINSFAIKMLFLPRKPKKFMGIKLHGIFPKRQMELTEKLGKIVSEELISFEVIEKKLTDVERIKTILPVVDTHIDDFLRNRLSQSMPMISMFIGEKTINELKSIFMKEMEEVFPRVMQQYFSSVRNDQDLKAMLRQKIASVSTDQLELMIKDLLSAEFRFFQMMGAGLGLVIGMIYVMVSWLGFS